MPIKATPERRFIEMAHRHLLISFDELDEIEISCQCGTGIVISALKTAPNLRSTCPGCERSLHVAATAAAGFRQFFSAAKEFASTDGQRMEFRVREE